MKKLCSYILAISLLCVYLYGCNTNIDDVSMNNDSSVATKESPNITTTEASVNEIFEEQDAPEYLDAGVFDVLYDEHPNYQLFSDEQLHGYYYKIIDNDGEVFDSGFLSWRFRDIALVAPNIVGVRTSSGGHLSSSKFYDCENQRVSRVFPNYLAISDELIAYFDTDGQSIVLRIENIFDKRLYSYAIADESFTVSIMTWAGNVAAFSDDQQSIIVTYPDESGNSISKEFSLEN